jgi:hypothetical protein
MKTYLIQRNLPGAGNLNAAERKAIAQRSCQVIQELGNENLEWQHSYITGDNLWCVYKAVDEQVLREHAKRGPFPCDNIREIHGMLTPATAEIHLKQSV